VRSKIHHEDGLVGAQRDRRRLELQAGLPAPLIQTGVGKCNGVSSDLGAVLQATARTFRAPNLKDVGKVRGEVER
jgi:hypothetical protein